MIARRSFFIAITMISLSFVLTLTVATSSAQDDVAPVVDRFRPRGNRAAANSAAESSAPGKARIVSPAAPETVPRIARNTASSPTAPVYAIDGVYLACCAAAPVLLRSAGYFASVAVLFAATAIL